MNRYNIDITEITTHLATHQPRALELTMTEEQLFRQQNPLWAKAYTKSDMEIIAQMYFYLSYIHYHKSHEELCDIIYKDGKTLRDCNQMASAMKFYMNSSSGVYGGTHGNRMSYSKKQTRKEKT